MTSQIGDLIKVSQVPPELLFICDQQDVEALAPYLPKDSTALLEYQSFFVKVGNAEYEEIWGMEGIVPYLWKTVERVL